MNKFLSTLQLNRITVGVLLYDEGENPHSTAINSALGKILKSCSSKLNSMVVIDMSHFVNPCNWSQAHAIVNYDDTQRMLKDVRSRSEIFQITIINYSEKPWNFTTFMNSIVRGFPSFINMIVINDTICESRNFMHSIRDTHYENVIFICRHNVTHPQLFIYSRNTDSKSAPKPWKNSPLRSIFRQSVPDEEFENCESLFYRKFINANNPTKFLKANVKPFPPFMTVDVNDQRLNISYQEFPHLIASKIRNFTVRSHMWAMFGGFDGKIIATIFRHMHRTANVLMFPENGTINHALLHWVAMKENIGNGGDAINLNSRDLADIPPDMAFIKPVIQREITVAINSRGYVSVQRRINEIFQTPIIISALVVSGLVIFFFAYCDGRGFGRATLEASNLILGFAIAKLPKNLATRIIFGSSIIYYIIISSTLQGNFTEILTVPIKKSQVESLEELKSLGYKLYAGYSIAKNFEFFQKDICDFIVYEGEHCTDVLLDDPLAACIDEAEYLKNEVANNENLEIIKHPLRTFFVTYLVDKSWILKKRFEDRLTTLNEGGFLQKWSNTHSQSRENLQSERDLTDMFSMNYGRMTIAFIILGVGLTISTIVFIGEILVFRGYFTRK